MVLDVLHQNLKLGRKRFSIARHRLKLLKEHFHLSVLLDAFAGDLLQLFVAVLEQEWVKDRLFDMGVDDELPANLSERIAVVAVLIRLYLLKKRVHLVVVRFQQLESVCLTSLV